MVNGPLWILYYYFQTKLRPKELKKFFWRPGPSPLPQGLDDQAPPPPPPYLKVWICHCIIIQLLLTCASKTFACLVVLVAGKFYGISSLKIFDQLCASLADETENKYQTTQCNLWLSVVQYWYTQLSFAVFLFLLVFFFCVCVCECFYAQLCVVCGT